MICSFLKEKTPLSIITRSTMWQQNNEASKVLSFPLVQYMHLPEYGTKNIIYYLLLCIHGLRYMLVTRSFIFPAGPLSHVNITVEKQSSLSSIFSVKCSFCGHLNEVKSSREHRAGSRAPLVSDINTRACWHGEYTPKQFTIDNDHTKNESSAV